MYVNVYACVKLSSCLTCTEAASLCSTTVFQSVAIFCPSGQIQAVTVTHASFFQAVISAEQDKPKKKLKTWGFDVFPLLISAHAYDFL